MDRQIPSTFFSRLGIGFPEPFSSTSASRLAVSASCLYARISPVHASAACALACCALAVLCACGIGGGFGVKTAANEKHGGTAFFRFASLRLCCACGIGIGFGCGFGCACGGIGFGCASLFAAVPVLRSVSERRRRLCALRFAALWWLSCSRNRNGTAAASVAAFRFPKKPI